MKLCIRLAGIFTIFLLILFFSTKSNKVYAGCVCASTGCGANERESGTCTYTGGNCPDGFGVQCCGTSCPSASSVACNSPVNNACGDYCGYYGSVTGCADPATVSCGTPISGYCGQCASGTKDCNTATPTSCSGSCECANSTNVGSQCWDGCSAYCPGRYIPPTATPTNTPTPVPNPCTNANGTCFTTSSCDALSPPKAGMGESCNDSNKQCCGDNLTTCSAIGGDCYSVRNSLMDCSDIGRVDKSSGTGCGGSQICCGGVIPPTSTPLPNVTSTPTSNNTTPIPTVQSGEVCGDYQCRLGEDACKTDNSNISTCCLSDCGWTNTGSTSVWSTCSTGNVCPPPDGNVSFDILCQNGCASSSVCKQSRYCPSAPPQAQSRSCTSDSQCNDPTVFGPICNPPLTPNAYAGMSCNTSTGECVQNCTPTGCGTATCTCINNYTQSCTNSCGTSTSSTNNCNSCNGVTPLAPVINSTPTANCSTKDLYVDWNRVSCANYYYLTYTNNAGHSVTVTDTGNRNDWDIKPTPGTTYTFQVRGVNAISTPIPGTNSAAVNFAIPLPACGPFTTQYTQTPQQSGPVKLSIGQTTTTRDPWKNDFWVAVWTSLSDGIGPGTNPSAANGGAEGADGRADIRWYGLTQGAGSTWGGSFETGNHPAGTTGHFNADSWALGCFGNTSCGNIDITRVAKTASVVAKDVSGVVKTSFSSTENINFLATGNAGVIPGKDTLKVYLVRADGGVISSADVRQLINYNGTYSTNRSVDSSGRIIYSFVGVDCDSVNGVACSSNITTDTPVLDAGDYYIYVAMPAAYGAESANVSCSGNPFAPMGTTRCSTTGADRVAFMVRPAVAPTILSFETTNKRGDVVVSPQTDEGLSKNHLCQAGFRTPWNTQEPGFKVVISDSDVDPNSRGIKKIYLKYALKGSENSDYWLIQYSYNSTTLSWDSIVGVVGSIFSGSSPVLTHAVVASPPIVSGAKTDYTYMFDPIFDISSHREYKMSVYAEDVDGLPLSPVSDGFVDVGRSFKVWDCKVNVTGALYDASGSPDLATNCNSTTSWLTPYAKDTVGNRDLISLKYNGTIEAGPSVDLYPQMNPIVLPWGATYSPQMVYKNMVDPLSFNKRTTSVVSGIGTTTVCVGTAGGLHLADGDMNTAFSPYNVNGNMVVDFTTVTFDGWYQVKGAGANASGNLVDNIPSTCTTASSCVPALSITVGTQDDGLISSTTFDKTFGHVEEATSNSRLWSVRKNLILSKPTYDSMYNDFFVKRGTGSTIVATGGVVNLTGKTGLVFVKGTDDITINADFTPSAFFMLVAKGNISIEGNVTSLGGVYFAGSNVNIGGTNDTQLTIKGVVHAYGDVSVSRSVMKTDTNGVWVKNNDYTPAVIFEYDPGLLFNTPKELNSSLGVWLETAQ